MLILLLLLLRKGSLAPGFVKEHRFMSAKWIREAQKRNIMSKLWGIQRHPWTTRIRNIMVFCSKVAFLYFEKAVGNIYHCIFSVAWKKSVWWCVLWRVM